MTTGLVTIAQLIRDQNLLEVGCLGCGRHVHTDAGICSLRAWLPVPEAATRLAG